MITRQELEVTQDFPFQLVRDEYSANGIFGTLRTATGEEICKTLERSYNSKPKLPVGSYVCKRDADNPRLSKIFKTNFVSFEVTGVPGHSGILFHPGNKHTDSDGCILVGSTRDKLGVYNSRATFKKLMERLEGLDSFMLNVR